VSVPSATPARWSSRSSSGSVSWSRLSAGVSLSSAERGAARPCAVPVPQHPQHTVPGGRAQDPLSAHWAGDGAKLRPLVLYRGMVLWVPRAHAPPELLAPTLPAGTAACQPLPRALTHSPRPRAGEDDSGGPQGEGLKVSSCPILSPQHLLLGWDEDQAPGARSNTSGAGASPGQRRSCLCPGPRTPRPPQIPLLSQHGAVRPGISPSSPREEPETDPSVRRGAEQAPQHPSPPCPPRDIARQRCFIAFERQEYVSYPCHTCGNTRCVAPACLLCANDS